MTTAQTIIDRSLKLLGAIGSGESPTVAESADALVSLNAMIDSWKNERLIVWAIQDESLAQTGAASYTIGPTGNLNTVAPVNIVSAFYRLDGIDYPVQQLSKEEWDLMPQKTLTGGGYPEYFYFKASEPLGYLYTWPQVSSGTLYLQTWVPLSTLAATSTTVVVPAGYERALAYNLALEISPEYQLEPAGLVMQIARESKAAIKRTNQPKPVLSMTLPVGSVSASIFTG